MHPDVDSLNLWQRIQLAWSLMRDDRVAPWIKRLGPAAIIAYVVSPIDIIPDILLGAGQVDDLGVIAIGLVILLRLMVRFAPAEVVDDHIARITGAPRQRAASSPPGRDDPIDVSGRVRR